MPSDKNLKAILPDVSDYCVIWYSDNVRGHQQKFFHRFQRDDAFEFAHELMLDESNFGVQIIHTENYYLSKRRKKKC